jgi:hypothetical protein
VFDNDQTEIGYNNDNSVTGGETDDRSVGGPNMTRTFQRRDPRVVFPVEAGKIYFVQVESGQLQNFNLTFPKVDWRHAAGGYELLINSMSNLNFDDDHVNGTGANVQATPIPIDLGITSTTATLGSVRGEIRNTGFNLVDSDLFFFLAPASGNAKITVSPTNNDSFTRIVSVFDIAGQLIGTTTANGTTAATITVAANQGDRFYVSVQQSNNPPPSAGLVGRYSVGVSGIPYSDDHASEPDYFSATVVDKNLYDYDGTETLTGKIESVGDTDAFSFTTIAYDVVNVTVQGMSPGFHPTVRIYEISKDGANIPILLNIGFNSAGTTATASYNFSVTAPPRTSGTDQFNTYFVVVGGADPNADRGDYSMTLTFGVTTDDHPDAGQFDIATEVTLDPMGVGAESGSIELAGDTDLFQFVSSSQGTATITLTSPANSLLFPRVRIFDSSHQAVSDLNGQFFVTGPDQQVSMAVFKFTASRNETYFIQVEGVAPFGNTFKTAEVGAYTIDIAAPIPDDHPNVGEFTIADPIILSPFSGDGSANGTLEIGDDSDLFKFVAVANGSMAVTLTSPANTFRPFVRFFDSNGVEIGTAVRDGGPGDEDGQLDGSVKRTLQGMTLGTTYFVASSSDQTEPPNHQTGGYIFLLNGTAPPQGPDDHPDAGDYDIATVIPLSPLSGDATQTGTIEISSDSDLFVFNSLAGSSGAPKKAFIQVITASGITLDAGLRIYKNVNGTPIQITSDTVGSTGINAQVEFDIDAPLTKYWVEVDGLGGTGAYTIRIDTAPDKFFLYYPEGFANSAIREYIAMGNDNAFDVSYTVTLRYEDNTIPDRRISRVIPAHSRGGETISDGTTNPPSGVVFNKPYTIIIESNGFLGANISHYDFGNTLGESFTSRTSSSWSFSEGQKLHGAVRDFVIYYNPNPTSVRVTLTAFLTDPNTHSVTTTSIAQVVGGNRRSGWNIDDTSTLPVGTFAFTLTSAPVNSSDAHIGIVAALSHYDLATGSGYAVLGDPDGGATTGVIPGLVNGASASPQVTLFNPTNSVATVGIVGKYINSGLPDLIKNVTLQPGESKSMDRVALGLVSDQTVGLRYDSNVKVTVLAATIQSGDSDATQASTEAGTSFFFGDAFINRLRAGTLYFENMYFYNPDATALPVTLAFQFTDGATSSYTFSVGPKDFAAVALHTLPAILNHACSTTSRSTPSPLVRSPSP